MKRIHLVVGMTMGSIAGVCAGHATANDTSQYDLPGPSVVLPDGREVNAAATYWTDIVGVPFDRGAEVVVPPTPLDLDLDGRADVTFQGRRSLKGGILANPDLIWLVSTPEDPRGAGWVRVAPLILTASTAPYLHNGSVPTLEALLSSHEARPMRFMAGRAEQHFEFDTQLPGNSNSGHSFGRDLNRDERDALVAYLKSIR